MLIKLTGGKVYDPANKVSGEVRDIYVENGKIVYQGDYYDSLGFQKQLGWIQ